MKNYVIRAKMHLIPAMFVNRDSHLQVFMDRQSQWYCWIGFWIFIHREENCRPRRFYAQLVLVFIGSLSFISFLPLCYGILIFLYLEAMVLCIICAIETRSHVVNGNQLRIIAIWTTLKWNQSNSWTFKFLELVMISIARLHMGP